jgi:hypothetical protein
MSDLLDDAAKRASRYLESLDTRSVAPEKEAVAALAGFDHAFPEHASSAQTVLAPAAAQRLIQRHEILQCGAYHGRP